MKKKIEKITVFAAKYIIDERYPTGLFIFRETDKWIGIDNESGEAYTEEFENKKDAVAWLSGKFEMSEYPDILEKRAKRKGKRKK